MNVRVYRKHGIVRFYVHGVADAGTKALPPAGSRRAQHSPAGKGSIMDLHTARAALLRVEANLCTDETNIVALKVGALNDSLAIPLLLEAAFKNQRALVNLLLALLPGDVAAAAPIDDAAVQDAQAAAINERSREVPDAKAFVWLTRGRQESVGEVSIPDTGAPAHAP